MNVAYTVKTSRHSFFISVTKSLTVSFPPKLYSLTL